MTEDELIIEWLKKRRFVVHTARNVLIIPMTINNFHSPVAVADLDRWTTGECDFAFGLGLILFDKKPSGIPMKTLRDAVREWMLGL